MKTQKQSINVQNVDMNITKPEYKLKTMKEIESIPWNGFNVVSTFSGCGGSSLGYKLAGFKVLYANEFVEEAQKTYSANFKNTYLDKRDIRDIIADDILNKINLKRGELDILDGSPPCSNFSTAGKREKNWGRIKNYSDNKKQQVENLFFEYIRLLDGLRPKVFVAENVSGLVKGTCIGYFKEIIKEMKNCGYDVKAKLLNAKYLDVPQSRERLIFIGVRKDLNIEPIFPKPKKYIYTLKDAFKNLENDKIEEEYLLNSIKQYRIYNILKQLPKNPIKNISASKICNGSYFNLIRESLNCPCSTICQLNGQVSRSGNTHPLYDRKFTINELKRISSIPDDFILTGTFEQKWERLGRLVPPNMMYNIAKTIESEVLCRIK